ncbi:MAG: M48 metallopeptidase family protein, partial [Acidimicrobiales bacterium]
HGLPSPASIAWSDRQEWRWGSCTPAHGSVRISSRLAREPQWVLDYVIVHELAHLAEPGHGRRFWRLVERYPLTERARGFLIARALEPDAAGPPEPGDPATTADPGLFDDVCSAPQPSAHRR